MFKLSRVGKFFVLLAFCFIALGFSLVPPTRVLGLTQSKKIRVVQTNRYENPPPSTSTERPGPATSGRAVQSSHAGEAQTYDETGPHRIRPGDRLAINLVGEDWGGDFQVPPSGKIDFKFIGARQVAAHTRVELKKNLKKPLKSYYREPQLQVNFLSIRPQASDEVPPVYFAGHVSSQGPVQVSGPITFAKAISRVDGFSDRASPEEVRVFRQSGEIIVIDGFKQQDPSQWEGQPLKLHPGDYVYVPGGKFEESVSQIYVGGAVKRPSSGTVKEPVPLGVAVAKASDGLMNNANLKEVKVTRRNGDTALIDGEKQLELAGLPESERFYINPGDYVYIPSETTHRREVTVLGAVGEPQHVEITPGDGVMDALINAGSITRNSDRWKLYVFRKDDGETQVLTASYSRYVSGDLSQNIKLQANDVVYARTRFWPYFDTLQQLLQTIGISVGTTTDIDQLSNLGD